MKESLKNKIIEHGRIADELLNNQSFRVFLQEEINPKKESLLKEAIGSKSFEELRYNAGFLDGLDFLIGKLDQWSQSAKRLRKQN